jgi:hypothetical protein
MVSNVPKELKEDLGPAFTPTTTPESRKKRAARNSGATTPTASQPSLPSQTGVPDVEVEKAPRGTSTRARYFPARLQRNEDISYENEDDHEESDEKKPVQRTRPVTAPVPLRFLAHSRLTL